jgi:hypothetical protein
MTLLRMTTGNLYTASQFRTMAPRSCTGCDCRRLDLIRLFSAKRAPQLTFEPKASVLVSSNIREIASRRFFKHSSLDLPCPFAPGTSAQYAMYQGPSCSTITVNSWCIAHSNKGGSSCHRLRRHLQPQIHSTPRKPAVKRLAARKAPGEVGAHHLLPHPP